MAGNNTIEIRVDGVSELKDRFLSLDVEGRKRVNRQVNINALEYRKAVITSIRKISGRYKEYKRGRKLHYSSMPGSPPNSDKGNLVKNIIVTKKATLLDSFAYVKSGANYSAALEFARNSKRKRPFMLPMLRKKRKLFVSRIKEAIRGLL